MAEHVARRVTVAVRNRRNGQGCKEKQRRRGRKTEAVHPQDVSRPSAAWPSVAALDQPRQGVRRRHEPSDLSPTDDGEEDELVESRRGD